MSRRALSEKPLQRLQLVLVPGTTGELYTLVPVTTGFYVILVVYLSLDAHFTGREGPAMTGELLMVR
ncbi:hypothetical protein [Deinococcus hopiensis]|uniref:Uncharacterized protein n=1 Tax=Deinococcus hopiensis KR-140 TaxID=695939 RepID=A0A1W1VET0_9DEIO|nr:hypothetical protein [Deinococcus hopiensis]SMB91816.1 hypothetical protein SAMN00790413_01307 [Deinococcus hopiensis KR-140]